MEQHFSTSLLICTILSLTATSFPLSDDRRAYIIHMDKSKMPAPFSTHHSWYTSTLTSLSSPEGTPPTHLYTYKNAMDGFSAVLSRYHLEQLEKMPAHLATYEETFGHLHTTHTPEFLGLSQQTGLWPVSDFGDDMIIGIVDTGIWPESDSFNDDGIPPVSGGWRGTCETGTAFNSSNCNKKLIGARSFNKGIRQAGLNISTTDDYDSPRDFVGHGTHTSSTAAGSAQPFANHFGYANGTATGMAPKARLAMYKVLFFNGTSDAAATDTLAGIDQAIEDGVDLLSLSLGFFTTPFYEDPIAVGAFAAMERGIFVACSAGNRGPHAYTILNGAPWITTVGAGTIDRNLSARLTLGDGEIQVVGKSVYPQNLLVDRVPIYFGHGNRSKEICDTYTLNPDDVKGKYIFCDFNGEISVFQQLFEMYRTGAAGAIFSSDSGQFLQVKDFNKPFVTVSPWDGELVKNCIIKSRNPTVSIKFQVTLLGTKPAPQVADFSSRGPVLHAPWILKPDILAPGVDVLAAWTPNRASATIGDDFLLTDYALVSGTSMSSPHIVGIAALLKAAHKDWSPAAIRSAMMTTADILDNANNPIMDIITGVTGTPLDFGGGHVNPNKAMDPGLVYDIGVQDYINYMCALNYTTIQLQTITRRSNVSCEASIDLNYPSFIVILNNTNTTSYTFKRVLTNVIDANCTYHATVEASSGIKVSVQPATIYFPRKHSTSTFNLTVEINLGLYPTSDYIGNYGFLTWYEDKGTHVVRSPIVSAFSP